MSEEISVRECARRLGVSDTAIRKARKEAEAGRPVRVYMTDSGKVLWEETKAAWLARSDVSKRSHVGSQGGARREKDRPRVHLATSDRMDEGSSAAQPRVALPPDADPDDEDGPASGRGGQYAKSRAKNEFYKAELARIDFEQKSGNLVDAREQERQGAALGAIVIAGLYNIPERVSDDLAGMTDPHAIHKLLTAEIDLAVEKLRELVGAAG